MNFLRKPRGAAMAEYVTLLALIGLASMGTVASVGKSVVGTMEEAEGAVRVVNGGGVDREGTFVIGGKDEEAGDEDQVGPTFTWKGDGTSELPSYVQVTSNGWRIDIEPLLEGVADPTDAVAMSQLRFDAQLSQSGEVYPRSYATWGYRTSIQTYWERPGNDASLLSGDTGAYSPDDHYFELNREASGRDLPDDATGIVIRRNLICNPGSTCTPGDLVLNVNIYRQQ